MQPYRINARGFESLANVTSQIISQATAAGLGGAVGAVAGGATGNADIGAIAGAATIPPALSWCLSNPVTCNRIVIGGGEIAAGEALGPAGLGVIGTASAVKAVRSADEVNATMKAKG